MTGVELILLLIGSVFMIGSFFITEKLSPSELNKIAELSESELKKIINRAMDGAEKRIDAAIEERIELSSDKVDRALEKETNEKIMAISEYSDTVVESMNKTHNEIMFLYSMLNDKHTELTGMVSNLSHMAADVRSLEENLQLLILDVADLTPVASVVPEPEADADKTVPPEGLSQAAKAAATPKTASKVSKNTSVPKNAGTERKEAPKTAVPGTAVPRAARIPLAGKPAQTEEKGNANEQILALYRDGVPEVEIARRLGLGVGEIRLVIGLYRGEDS